MRRRCAVGWMTVVLLSVGTVAASQSVGAVLDVVATTSIVAEVVGRVAGDRVEVLALVPVGGDPHAIEPTPRELAGIERADVVFVNGAGLENDVAALLEAATGPVVSLSEGMPLLEVEGGAHDHGAADPHVWLDPTRVMAWTRIIEATLSELDPDGAASYAAAATAYRELLAALDLWIFAETAKVPAARRILLTDHASLGYFASRYGFATPGQLYPGATSLAEPSAREIADLETLLLDLEVRAIFVSSTANASLAEAVARDTGAVVVPLVIGSLTAADGPAASYEEMMRWNVRAIVDALIKPEPAPGDSGA